MMPISMFKLTFFIVNSGLSLGPLPNSAAALRMSGVFTIKLRRISARVKVMARVRIIARLKVIVGVGVAFRGASSRLGIHLQSL